MLPADNLFSIENSPLTTDVHRCLTGADYLNLPEPHERPLTDNSETDRGGNELEQGSLTPKSASSDTDSLSHRVASLLNKSGDYNENRNRTPLIQPEPIGATSAESADMAANFNTGSFLTSSRVVPNSLSPSKLPNTSHFSYYASAGGSVDDLVAPPAEFADSAGARSSATIPDSVPKFSTQTSAVQTLLKSLEWDHAWDVSAPTGFSTRSPNKFMANESFSAEIGRVDLKSTSPKSPKHILFSSKDDATSMPRVASKPPLASSSYTPSTSPDFSSAKYFSEMKHLVEEQMQRREALIAPLLRGPNATSGVTGGGGVSSYSNGGSSTVTRSLSPNRYFSTASSDTGMMPPPPPVIPPPPPIHHRYDFSSNRSVTFDYDSLDLNRHRLPPAGPTRNYDYGLSRHHHGISFFSEYARDRLSNSQSDLTTVTPRAGSGFSLDHHHHDLSHLDLHSRVADILARREASRGSSDQHTRSSSNQSGEEATTTVESTHPGSNDAIPPAFPPGIYGNRPAKPYSSGTKASYRLDASVQTSVPRTTRPGDKTEHTSFPSMTSSGVQTSAARQPLQPRVNTASVTDTFSSRTDQFTKPTISPTTTAAGNIDLKTIVTLLEEPIRAAVRRCLETELRAANIGEHTSRPTSRNSGIARRSPSAHGYMSSAVGVTVTGRSSSLSRHHSTDHEAPTESPTATETLTTATSHIERMLETERRIAEMAKVKAEEQAKRVKRLEEVLAEQTTTTVNDHVNMAEAANQENRRPSRSPSPISGHRHHSHSPARSPQHHSPARSPARSPKAPVYSPVAWFVPANEPGAPRRKPKTRSPPNGKSAVRMEFAGPNRQDHNYITGRIQQMLDPVSPTKSRDEVTLQDALRLSNRSFIVRSTERLRRLRLHAIERRLSHERKKASAVIDIERDDFLEEQAKKMKETEDKPKLRKSIPSPGTRRAQLAKTQAQKISQKSNISKPKTADELLFAELLACDTASVASTTSEMKRIRADTHRRALLLPEAIVRAERERRALQAKQNRLRCEIFKQKVLNKLLGRKKWSLPRCLCSDAVLDRVLLH